MLLQEYNSSFVSFIFRPTVLRRDTKLLTPRGLCGVLSLALVSWTTCGAFAIVIIYLQYWFKVLKGQTCFIYNWIPNFVCFELTPCEKQKYKLPFFILKCYYSHTWNNTSFLNLPDSNSLVIFRIILFFWQCFLQKKGTVPYVHYNHCPLSFSHILQLLCKETLLKN